MLLYFIRGLFVIMIAAALFVSIGYNQAIQDRTPDAENLYDLAVQMEQDGDMEGAVENYRKALDVRLDPEMAGQDIMFIFVGGLAVAIIVLAIDWLTPKKSLSALAGIFFGLLVGILISWALSSVMVLIDDLFFNMSPQTLKMSTWIMSICICYLSISLVIRTKDDVRFVIPYIEFSRQTKGMRPLVLDTSVIIDGRIADIANTKLFDAALVVPRFVLNELQLIADSSDNMKRARGRRGLDMLNKLQDNPVVEVVIDDTPPPGLDAKAEVDHKLVAFSKNCDGRLVTNDYNLNKVAQLRGVDVININDLANAMKTITLPGEGMTIKVIRTGEELTQGVGFMDDGTMVVVEGARDKVGETIDISITSSLQTSAGRMVFGKYEKTVSAGRKDRSNSNGRKQNYKKH
ncbi:MAG TPA: PIN/TRAM domain-containing protein [Phycisphaerales bacterium]|nr:PIN/TRAM domain-containing protein [Phycisphaerales bacterium]